MWIFNSTLIEIALRALIIYFVVLIGIRLTGKREIGQMTPFDLVLLLLIANSVQNAMTGPDTSVSGGLVAAGTLLVVNTLVTRFAERSSILRKIIEGSPTLLIRNGKVIQKNLTKENITTDELHQALREHGVNHIKDVSFAVLEIDGTISVLRSDEMPTHPRPHHRIRFLSKKTA